MVYQTNGYNTWYGLHYDKWWFIIIRYPCTQHVVVLGVHVFTSFGKQVFLSIFVSPISLTIQQLSVFRRSLRAQCHRKNNQIYRFCCKWLCLYILFQIYLFMCNKSYNCMVLLCFFYCSIQYEHCCKWHTPTHMVWITLSTDLMMHIEVWCYTLNTS